MPLISAQVYSSWLSIASSSIAFVRLDCSAICFLASIRANTYSSFLIFAGTDFNCLPFFSQMTAHLPPSSISSHTVTSPTSCGWKYSLMPWTTRLSIRRVSLVTSWYPALIAILRIAVETAAASLALLCAPNCLLSFLNFWRNMYLSFICSSFSIGRIPTAMSRSLFLFASISAISLGSSYLPSAASAYFLALVCFAPSEMYFAALYMSWNRLSPSLS